MKKKHNPFLQKSKPLPVKRPKTFSNKMNPSPGEKNQKKKKPIEKKNLWARKITEKRLFFEKKKNLVQKKNF